MNLSDFIKATLVDVSMGVANANSEVDLDDGSHGLPFDITGESIDFDIAVTVKSSAAASGEAGAGGIIEVLGVNLNAEINGETGHEKVSRIKFSIKCGRQKLGKKRKKFNPVVKNSLEV